VENVDWGAQGLACDDIKGPQSGGEKGHGVSGRGGSGEWHKVCLIAKPFGEESILFRGDLIWGVAFLVSE